MKRFVMTLHRWLGFPLGLVFLVTFGTGCLTAVDEVITRIDHSIYYGGYEFQSTSLVDDARMLTTITEGKEAIRMVVMPTPATPYYQLVTRNATWTYGIDDRNQTDYRTAANEGFFHTVLNLHRQLLLGREGLWGVDGKVYVAWVGLMSLLLSLLGIWLWYPSRKTFSAKAVVPLGRKRKHFYYSHMTSGIVVVIVILLLAVTGAAITYRELAQQLLGVKRDQGTTGEGRVIDPGWQSWLAVTYGQMPPGSRLETIRFPRQSEKGRRQNTEAKGFDKQSEIQLLEFRFRAPGDWLTLPLSQVKIDKQSSKLIATKLYGQQTLGGKIYAILVPLHTGRQLPVVYVLGLLVMSLLGSVMVMSGLVSFIAKKRKWKKLGLPISSKNILGSPG